MTSCDRLSSDLSVLVPGATGRAGLMIVRNLGRAGFRVIGADSRLLPFGLCSRYSEPYHIGPTATDPTLLDKLERVLLETRPDVFFPYLTLMVGAVSRARDRFEALTSLLIPPFEAFLAAEDNLRTMKECEELAIPCPRVLSVKEAETLLEVRGDVESRMVVVKPRRDVGGARGVSFCRGVEDLRRKMDECRDTLGEPLVQEWIPGGADSMRTVIVLFDRDGRLAAYFTTRKVRQWPVTGGLTAMSVSTADRSLLHQVLPFFEKWGWRGPAEVELKVDPRDAKAKVIEINPRFPSYTGFPIRCGLHLPRLAVLGAVGRLPTGGCPPYTVGMRYVSPALYIKAAGSELLRSRDKQAILRQVWRELRRGAVTNNPVIWDPLPRIGKLLRGAADLFRGRHPR